MLGRLSLLQDGLYTYSSRYLPAIYFDVLLHAFPLRTPSVPTTVNPFGKMYGGCIAYHVSGHIIARTPKRFSPLASHVLYTSFTTPFTGPVRVTGVREGKLRWKTAVSSDNRRRRGVPADAHGASLVVLGIGRRAGLYAALTSRLSRLVLSQCQGTLCCGSCRFTNPVLTQSLPVSQRTRSMSFGFTVR